MKAKGIQLNHNASDRELETHRYDLKMAWFEGNSKVVPIDVLTVASFV